MQENRRVDDARIGDIQDSVHEIRSDVRGLERRLERSDDRISDVERSVIETAAAQKALESVMNAENRRLSDKIDGVQTTVSETHKSFMTHTQMEEKNSRQMMRSVIMTFIALLGTIAWWMFKQHVGGE